LRLPRPAISSLFPYTTLFRSQLLHTLRRQVVHLHSTSVATGNRSTCPTRSRPGSTPGFSALISATICPVCASGQHVLAMCHSVSDRKSTRLNSSHVKISYAVF